MDDPKYTQLPQVYTHYDGIEAIRSTPDHEGMQPMASETRGGPLYPDAAMYASDTKYWHSEAAPQEKRMKGPRICGLTPWIFWTIIAAVILVAVIAGVVGGVVGSREDSDNTASDKASGNSGTTTTSSSQPTTTTVGPSIVTTEIIGPSSSSTLYRDCPSVNTLVYTYPQNAAPTSSPQLFEQRCNAATYNTHGIDAVVNQPVKDLSACINLCGQYNLANQASIKSGEDYICNSVCWRNTFDTDFPGQCFGYSSANVSGYWNISSGAAASVCDSGLLINSNVILD